MAFVLTTSGSYEWPVDVLVPQGDGSFKTLDFIGEFKRLPQSRIDEIQTTVRDQFGKTDLFIQLTDDMILDEVFLGWKGVTDDAGTVLQVTPENRKMLLEFRGVKIGIMAAWFGVVNGIERKNSSPPPPTGVPAASPTTVPTKT